MFLLWEEKTEVKNLLMIAQQKWFGDTKKLKPSLFERVRFVWIAHKKHLKCTCMLDFLQRKEDKMELICFTATKTFSSIYTHGKAQRMSLIVYSK